MKARRRNPIKTARHKFPIRDKTALSHEYGKARAVKEELANSVVYVGMVINPKTMRPYMVYRTGFSGLRLIVPTTMAYSAKKTRKGSAHQYVKVEKVGGATLEESEGEYSAPAEITGMPRIHTPSGIPTSERGTGLGTAVYTAGALTAVYAEALGEMRGFPGIGENVADDQGVSSGYGASTEAQMWWRNAEKRGLTEEVDLDSSYGSSSREKEEMVSFEMDVSIDPDSAINSGGISDQLENEPYEGGSWHENLESAARDEDIDEIEEWTIYSADPQTSAEVNIKFEATLTFTISPQTGGDSVDIEENVEDTYPFDLEAFAGDPDYWITDLLEDNPDEDSALEKAAKELEVDVDDLEVDSVDISVDSYEAAHAGYVEITVEYSVQVRGYAEGSDEPVFKYPAHNAARAGLILDVSKSLYGFDYPDNNAEEEVTIFNYIPGAAKYQHPGVWPEAKRRRALEIVLGLDLGEVEDPKVFEYFFKFANDLGASYSEQKRFQNSVLAYRSDVPLSVDFGIHGADLHRDFEEAGFRVNPATGESYEEIGRQLFGPIADLD